MVELVVGNNYNNNKIMKICGVYKIINPNGKIYIGSSLDILKRFKDYKKLNCKKQTRLYNSLLKHGWENHIFEIIAIEQPENRLKYEHILGIMFDVLNRDRGLNCQLPSYDNISAKTSEETKMKISYKSIERGSGFKGEELRKILLLSNKSCYKTVYQFDKNKIFIREYISINHAVKEFFPNLSEQELLKNRKGSLIGRVCNGKSSSAYGYLWSFNRGDTFNKLNLKVTKRKIEQYDLENNLLNTFESITKASLVTGLKLCNICNSIYRNQIVNKQFKFK